jgi:Undecaprenyl-phosphate glucose phosphotransferase
MSSSTPVTDAPAWGQLVAFSGARVASSDSSVLSSSGHLFLRGFEGLIIVLCSLLADVGYHALLWQSASFAGAFWAAGLLAAILYVVVMHAREQAQPLRSINSPEALRDVCVVWLGTIGAVAFFVLALKSGADISRGATLLFAILGVCGLVGTRLAVPQLLEAVRCRAGRRAQQAIVIGLRGDMALDALLGEMQRAGIGAVGVVRLGHRQAGRSWEAELETMRPLILETARTAPDGDICIAAGGMSERELHDLIVLLQAVPRAVRIVPAPSIEQFLHFPVRSIGRLLAVEPQRAPQSALHVVAKRFVDIAGALAALVLLSPVLLAAAAAIRLETGGPVLFRQDRLGHRGRAFQILKFRTMTVAENGDVVQQACAGDQRVTRVGRVLRQLSIDELPQLFNVLRGEMSLVGPRPHAVAHDRYYATIIDNYELRQHVKPGITGWAQVNGLRGATTDPDLMRRRVVHDIWYARNASVLLDMRILLMTVVEVFRQRNAH